MQIQTVSTTNQNFGRLSGQLQRLLRKSAANNPEQACEIAQTVKKICDLTPNSVVYLAERVGIKPGLDIDTFAGNQLRVRHQGILGLLGGKNIGSNSLKSKLSQPLELFTEILEQLNNFAVKK